MTHGDDLARGELVLTGRVMPASNATFVGTIGATSVVYKPVEGERPLWDFPDGTLAQREVATYLVSEAIGWEIVPRTWLRDGPLGRGMVQLWCEPDPHQMAVTLVPADGMPADGWRHVFDGIDGDGRPVSLIHEDSGALRRIAVFDIVVNNADRKGSHILEVADGHRYGIDHGLAFHADHKLRTVLWGWLGESLSDDEISGVRRILRALEGELGAALRSLLTGDEVEALVGRCSRLVDASVFPAPQGDMPAIPWPPL